MSFMSRAVQNNEEICIPLVVLTNFTQPIQNRFRLMLIKSGSGIVTINGSQLSFISPCLICLSDKETALSFSSEKPLETVEMVFHPGLLHPDYEHADPELILIQGFLRSNGNYAGMIQLDALSVHRLEGLMSALAEKLTQTDDEYWVCRSRSLLLEALVLTDRLYLNQIQEKNDKGLDREIPSVSPIVNDLLCYLHTHYEETITIETLSKVLHINRTTLNQAFKKELKVPITQYLIELRMEVAKVLLTGTLLQVSEIMARVGYGDLAHFNRTFKQRVGYTPSNFREKFSSQ